MRLLVQRWFVPLLVVLVQSALVGCGGSLDQTLLDMTAKEPEYKSSRTLPPLEIPPDLSSSAIRDQLTLPGELATGTANLSDLEKQQLGGAGQTLVLAQLADVRIERDGDKRWLVIDAAADEVWVRVREFWFDGGFLLNMEDPLIGIMETEWAENRADIPTGFFRGILERISKKLYSAATRDKFRVRLEKGAEPGTTEIFLSHRGAEEVAQGEGFVWQPRPSDPELEIEMLSRLVVYFGISTEHADNLLAENSSAVDRAQMSRDDNGSSLLILDEEFSRAWRRTGLALDRVGFTVEDRDRSRGLYYVRYVDPLKDSASEKDGGWFSKLKFWGGDTEEVQVEEDAYLISLIADGSTTQLAVLNTAGERESSSTADRILSLLYDQLN